MLCSEVRNAPGRAPEYVFGLGARVFLLYGGSAALHELLYRDRLEVVRCGEKYDLRPVLISYNESNIQLARLQLGGRVEYQLSSQTQLQGYYISSRGGEYRIVKPSFVFVHVYSSADRQWRVFSWGQAFPAGSSFALLGQQLFHVNGRRVTEINTDACQVGERHEGRAQHFLLNSASAVVGSLLVNFGGREGQCSSKCMQLFDLVTHEESMYKLNDIRSLAAPHLVAIDEHRYLLYGNESLVYVRRCEQYL